MRSDGKGLNKVKGFNRDGHWVATLPSVLPEVSLIHFSPFHWICENKKIFHQSYVVLASTLFSNFVFNLTELETKR